MKTQPTAQPATHTPGAWIQETNDAGRQIRITDSATESRCIATVAIFGDADNSRANARLIAAAPDLLAALEKIHANAAESPEWIRNVTAPLIARAKGQA